MKPLPAIPEGDIGNTWVLNLAIAGGGFRDENLNSLASVLIRKVDLAAYEYTVARCYWQLHGTRDDARGTVALSIPAAGDHLELCILSLRRAIRCFDRIRRSRLFPRLDRLLRRRIEHAEPDLTKIRNTIEHIDDEIAAGLDQDDPHTLLLSLDGRFASISDVTLSIARLYNCITLLQEVAKALATHRVS